mmetsp:Transcript_13333/g.40245  ORF Transcript_13333/g.40245 Transcript_13333/m.40245 type:complete len:211 (+) Transcript_13333:2981-3613(+)
MGGGPPEVAPPPLPPPPTERATRDCARDGGARDGGRAELLFAGEVAEATEDEETSGALAVLRLEGRAPGVGAGGRAATGEGAGAGSGRGASVTEGMRGRVRGGAAGRAAAVRPDAEEGFDIVADRVARGRGATAGGTPPVPAVGPGPRPPRIGPPRPLDMVPVAGSTGPPRPRPPRTPRPRPRCGVGPAAAESAALPGVGRTLRTGSAGG